MQFVLLSFTHFRDNKKNSNKQKLQWHSHRAKVARKTKLTFDCFYM